MIDNPATTAAAPPQHPPGFRRRRTQNWVFLGLMYGFFYMSRYNFSAISAVIGEKFGWTNAQYGSIISAGVFVYGLSVFFNGPLADKIGGKRAILIGSIGAAVFNLLFGLCFVFLKQPATWANGAVTHPAVLANGMKATTLIATFSVLWAANHYFQSFGALSIVKINAAWFHIKERGVFAGIFGIMIQLGRTLAYSGLPLLLPFLPWQFSFWIPSAVLIVMFFLNRRYVEDSPAKAGFEFHTADETAEEAAQKPSLGYVLRKVFASPAAWMIALSSMCIGMVRNSIDHWWTRYMPTVFSLKSDAIAKFVPFQVVSWGYPIAAILGGMAAGTISDKWFGSRRAPVIFFAFIGQGVTLALLSQGLHSPWIGCLLLLSISFFIQSAHSLVGGAASMDFGGKKAVATAAGLFDGAQYLAATFVGYGMGRLLDAFKDPKVPGAEFDVWPLAPIPFTIIGAILIARLWNVLPGHTAAPTSAEVWRARARKLAQVHTVERLAMGAWALLAGALAVLTVILPQVVARELYGHSLSASGLVLSQVAAGARIGLALLALTCAMTPRPPRALARALMIGLLACVVGPLFSAITQGVPWPELLVFRNTLYLDGLLAVTLLATSVARANLAPPPAPLAP